MNIHPPIDDLTAFTLFTTAALVALAVAPDSEKLPKPMRFAHFMLLEVLGLVWKGVRKIPLALFFGAMVAGGLVIAAVVVITAAVMAAIVAPFYLIKCVRARYRRYYKELK